MGHNQNKPGREKRKPKKEKLMTAKVGRDTEVLQHITQHGPAAEERH